MMCELPSHVWEMIMTMANKLKYDDVMKEMNSIDIKNQIKSLDYCNILFNAYDTRIVTTYNKMICSLESDAPEVSLCIDVLLIKRIRDGRDMIYKEIGLIADYIIEEIIKDALERNGLRYLEGENNMMKLMKM